jgi:hypothetical protein
MFRAGQDRIPSLELPENQILTLDRGAESSGLVFGEFRNQTPEKNGFSFSIPKGALRMHKNQALRIVGIVIVVIVVLIVIGALLRCLRKPSPKAADSSSSASRGSSSGSSNTWSHGDHKHKVHAQNQGSNYKVMTGKPVEPPQAEAAPSQEQAPRVPVNAAFPRNLAKAGKPVNTEALRKMVAEVSREAQAKVSAEEDVSKRGDLKVESAQAETIVVDTMADLYSPKEDLVAEYGVDEETLQKMVSSYRKNREYKERKIPVNRNFDIDKYNASKDTLRASAANMGVTYGSKRGQITGAIYKKYGKNFTKQSSQPAGDVPSLVSSPTLHAEQMRLSQARRNPGHLEVRK